MMVLPLGVEQGDVLAFRLITSRRRCRKKFKEDIHMIVIITLYRFILGFFCGQATCSERHERFGTEERIRSPLGLNPGGAEWHVPGSAVRSCFDPP